MPTPTESAELILKLYDLRREPVLREARAWFSREFDPSTLEDDLSRLHEAGIEVIRSAAELQTTL